MTFLKSRIKTTRTNVIYVWSMEHHYSSVFVSVLDYIEYKQKHL